MDKVLRFRTFGWISIDSIPHSAERVGFETQKPIALLERLITASSNKEMPSWIYLQEAERQQSRLSA